MAVEANDAGARRSPRWRWAARRLPGNDHGSVAVIFGLAATTLVAMVGGAMDYARLVSSRSNLQSAVDAGVMAGGNALKLVVSNDDSIIGLTRQTIETEAKAGQDAPVAVQVSVAPDRTSVTARAEQTIKLTFGPFVGLRTMAISAQARASVVGRMRLCMLALEPAAAGAFALQRDSQVTARGCALYSNSVSESGLVGLDNARVHAETICSSGGYLNARANFTPNPQVRCPAIQDPLRDRRPPEIGECRALPGHPGHPQQQVLPNGAVPNTITTSTTLEPGTYCGGLHISENAVVTLRPGIYVMRDGPLLVEMQATLQGTGVGFYFTGDRGGLLFDRGTTVSLTAPTNGPMAGILMSEVPSVQHPVDPALNASLHNHPHHYPITPTPPPLGATSPMRIYRIISNNARTMLGTIHLPAGRLVVDAEKPVADMSAYTVVVAQQINLYKGPNLYLNTQYSSSNVPVPAGVGPVAGRLRLTQ